MVEIDLYDGVEINIKLNKDYEYIEYHLYENGSPIILGDGDFAKIQIYITPDFPLVSSTSKIKDTNKIRNHTNPRLLSAPGKQKAELYVFDGDRKIKNMFEYYIDVTRE